MLLIKPSATLKKSLLLALIPFALIISVLLIINLSEVNELLLATFIVDADKSLFNDNP